MIPCSIEAGQHGVHKLSFPLQNHTAAKQIPPPKCVKFMHCVQKTHEDAEPRISSYSRQHVPLYGRAQDTQNSLYPVCRYRVP